MMIPMYNYWHGPQSTRIRKTPAIRVDEQAEHLCGIAGLCVT
jgi:hypothetical protein